MVVIGNDTIIFTNGAFFASLAGVNLNGHSLEGGALQFVYSTIFCFTPLIVQVVALGFHGEGEIFGAIGLLFDVSGLACDLDILGVSTIYATAKLVKIVALRTNFLGTISTADRVAVWI